MNSEVVTQTDPVITADHLRRLAVIYIRQSTQEQVRENTGSAEFQKSLAAVAVSYGWTKSQIQIIDDLGKSGSSTEGRSGWHRLHEMIGADQVGAVFAANISRLSRRLSDFELLRLKAAHRNTLFYMDGRFLNPADSNDTIVSQITAMVAQFENRKRAELMMQSRLAKAKRGEIVSHLPAGWIKAPDGKYAYDPAVKETIVMIINTFWQTRSLGRTVKLLAQAGITLPPRRGRSDIISIHAGQPIRGRKITHDRVRLILTHPAYAGTYVYGISRLQANGRDAGPRCITNHDCHPAYMSRQQQAEIKAILESGPPKRPVRRGRCLAVTKGLLRCAMCSETLAVSRPLETYVFRCKRTVQHTEKPCLSFSSNDLEPCILRQVFKVLKAPPIDLLKAALKASQSKRQTRLARIASERARLTQEEQSAQERAELTRGGLPSVHFDALEKLEKVLQEKDQFEQKIALTSAFRSDDTENELEELCLIATNVPDLWQHEAVTHQERKEILHCLIDHIVITATKERVDATIVWKSGGRTSVLVWRSLGWQHLLRELHAKQLTASEIKEHLAAGKTSTGQVVNLSLGNINKKLHAMGLRGARFSSSYLALRQRAAELCGKGQSLNTIARYFNVQGFTSALEKPWTNAMIKNLLLAIGHKIEPMNGLHHRLIAEARSRRLSDRQIAIEFNKTQIRRDGPQTWTARHVRRRWAFLKSLKDDRSQTVSPKTKDPNSSS